MKYGIIVDSGCDLRVLDNSTESDIYYKRIPLTLRVGEKEYIDDENLDIEEFMKDMKGYHGKTSSAAPAPQEWYDGFMMADEIFAIALTSELSGSYNSAMVAKKMANEKYPHKKIHVIDSKSAGPGLAMIAIKLKEILDSDVEFDKAVEMIEVYRDKTKLLFVLETFDNLMKNGRVSRIQGSMAGILGIKILCGASDHGTIDVLKKCRGKLSAYDNLIKEMGNKGYNSGKVIISHCFNNEKSDYIRSKIENIYRNASIEKISAGGLCSYYAEYGGVMVAFEG